MLRTVLATLLLTSSSLSFAQTSYRFGEPAPASAATREIRVDANDDMRFVPEKFNIRLGEVVTFVVTNSGKKRHEFLMGDVASHRAHQKMMAKNPHMHHDDDPTALTLAAGETKRLTWRFNQNNPQIEMACLIGRHYQDGMKASVTLSQ